MFRLVFVACALLGYALGAPALAAEFVLDANHTQAQFTVVHLGFGHVQGQIPVVSGTLTTGPGDVPAALSVTLSAKDLDSHSANRDRDLRGPDWFDVEKFPTMTFVAKQITGTAQAFKIVGDLTMHGVTKPVTLTGKEVGRMNDARGRTHIGYSANATLDRRDWNLLWGGVTPGGALVAGNEVTIDLNAEAVSK